MRFLLVLLLAAVCAAGFVYGEKAHVDSSNRQSLDELAWLSGSWTCEKSGGEFHEQWMDPAGDTMVGVGRLVVDGRTRFMEFMSIEAGPEGLTLWMLLGSPSRGPKEGKPFRLARINSKEAVFENRTNDFPRTITYRRQGRDGLLCRLDGTRDGQPAREDYPFRRKGAPPAEGEEEGEEQEEAGSETP